MLEVANSWTRRNQRLDKLHQLLICTGKKKERFNYVQEKNRDFVSGESLPTKNPVTLDPCTSYVLFRCAKSLCLAISVVSSRVTSWKHINAPSLLARISVSIKSAPSSIALYNNIKSDVLFNLLMPKGKIE